MFLMVLNNTKTSISSKTKFTFRAYLVSKLVIMRPFDL